MRTLHGSRCFMVKKSPRHPFLYFLDVVVERSLSSFPTNPILTCRFTVQTFSVLNVRGQKLQRTPLCIRSLEWVVWPTG